MINGDLPPFRKTSKQVGKAHEAYHGMLRSRAVNHTELGAEAVPGVLGPVQGGRGSRHRTGWETFSAAAARSVRRELRGYFLPTTEQR